MVMCDNIPYLNCGKICHVKVPDNLTNHNPPINLATVKVKTKNIKMPCILTNYSSNLAFTFSDFNPLLSIVYRLVRKSNHIGNMTILEQWEYKVSEVIPTPVEPVVTIEPLVLNYCDCLRHHCGESFTYIIQISEITTQNTRFKITNQEISSIVSSQNQDEISMIWN